ncbi:MAG: FAD-dependent oxidoreductase [Pseudomonadota bacterium]
MAVINIPNKFGLGPSVGPSDRADPNNTTFLYPTGYPDFRLHYQSLLDETHFNGEPPSESDPSSVFGNATGDPIAKFAQGRAPKIAVVGGGMAGLTAAHELARAGGDIYIFEAGDRLGGRHYSHKFDENDVVAAELGAMRFPASLSTVYHYARYLNISWDRTGNFPDPGAPDIVTAVNVPSLGDAPPGGMNPGKWPYIYANSITGWDLVEAMQEAFGNWVSAEKTVGQSRWQAGTFDDFWNSKTNDFKNITFGAKMQEVFENDAATQSYPIADVMKVFGAIGVGSGGFGPLFSISMLEMYRLILFNYEGDGGDIISRAPYTPNDGSGQHLFVGSFEDADLLGTSAFSRALYAKDFDARGGGTSSLQTIDIARNWSPLNKFVSGVKSTASPRGDDKSLTLQYYDGGPEAYRTDTFDYVVITCTPMAANAFITQSDFTKSGTTEIFSEDTKAELANLHHTRSGKVFFKIDDKIYDDDVASGLGWSNPIPQVTLGEKYMKQTYIYGLKSGSDESYVALMSYTWEDDAQAYAGQFAANGAFAPSADGQDQLARSMANQLDDIYADFIPGNKIADYFDNVALNDRSWSFIDWGTQVFDGYNPGTGATGTAPGGGFDFDKNKGGFYNGAFRLILPYQNDSLISIFKKNCVSPYLWTQATGSRTPISQEAAHGVFFAGDGISFSGGWTEAPIRTAINSVVAVVWHDGGAVNYDPVNGTHKDPFDATKPPVPNMPANGFGIFQAPSP